MNQRAAFRVTYSRIRHAYGSAAAAGLNPAAPAVRAAFRAYLTRNVTDPLVQAGWLRRERATARYVRRVAPGCGGEYRCGGMCRDCA